MSQQLVGDNRTTYRIALLAAVILAGLAVAAIASGMAASPAADAQTSSDGWSIDTVAGTGEFGFGGDGGPATEAQLGSPFDVAADADGNVYVADTWNHRVRRIDPSGTITTVAGTGERGFSGDGGRATNATLNGPLGVATDDIGNVYIADTRNYRIRKVDTDGVITTVAGTGERGFSGDGGPATEAEFAYPYGIAADGDGNVYVADLWNFRVRKVGTDGVITTVAGNGERGLSGDGGPATDAGIGGPSDVAVDRDGHLYIGTPPRVREVDADGVITTVAGGGDPEDGVGDGGPATEARLDYPIGLAVQESGVLYIAELYGSDVRRVDTSGTIDTVAGSGAEGFAGDGGYAPFAHLNLPRGVAVDGDGNLFVGDKNNNRLRRVRASHLWVSTTPAAGRAEEPFTYQLDLSGLPTTATGVTLTATAADEVDFAEAAAEQGECTTTADSVTCELGTVAAGATTSVEVTATAHEPGIIPLEATVRADDSAVPPHRSVTAQTLVSHAHCGRAISADTALAEDVGPCWTGDGVTVAADGVTLDLNGHRIFGDHRNILPVDGTDVGIRLTGRRDVTVENGTVSDFSAGIVIHEGGANTVETMTLRDNVGPDSLFDLPELGDGVFVFNSPDNAIVGNTLVGNGIYDGIGVWGPGADGNRVEDNLVEDTIGDVRGLPTGQGIIVNGATGGEPTTLSGTVVANNTVRGSGSAGIANINHLDGKVVNNLVVENGFANQNGNGIGVQMGRALHEAGETSTRLQVTGNEIRDNGWSGLQVLSEDNKLVNNNATDNGRAYGGVYAGTFFFDLEDRHEGGRFGQHTDCDNNTWNNNRWGSAGYAPDCTSTTGLGPGSNPADPGTADDLPEELSEVEDLPRRQPPSDAAE